MLCSYSYFSFVRYGWFYFKLKAHVSLPLIVSWKQRGDRSVADLTLYEWNLWCCLCLVVGSRHGTCSVKGFHQPHWFLVIILLHGITAYIKMTSEPLHTTKYELLCPSNGLSTFFQCLTVWHNNDLDLLPEYSRHSQKRNFHPEPKAAVSRYEFLSFPILACWWSRSFFIK